MGSRRERRCRTIIIESPDGVPANAAEIVTALRRSSSEDLRADVLALAARRDQNLGEEFLSKLKQDASDETAQSKMGPVPKQRSTVRKPNPNGLTLRVSCSTKARSHGQWKLLRPL